MNLGLEVAKRIREKRIAKGLTQDQLAERTGFDPSYIGRIERNESTNLTLKTLDRLIIGLDTDYMSFFSFDTYMSDNPKTNRKAAILHSLSLSQHEDQMLDIIERVLELDNLNSK